MKTKKILSLVLAMVMALALAVPAFASSNAADSLKQNTDITGTTKVPTIKITVPATAGVVLNPYQMTVKVKDGAIDSTGSESTGQIISANNVIASGSDVKLKVSASVTGKVAGTAKFATTSVAEAEAAAAADTTGKVKPVTANNVFVYFESVEITSATATPAWADAYAADTDGMAVLSTKAVTVNLGTMDAATTAGTDSAWIAFHLAGDAATAPTTAWTANDTVGATVAFTFTPTV